MRFKTERALYFFLMGLMGALIVLSIAFVYMSTNKARQKQSVSDELISAEEAGNTRQLSEYMLETLKGDELEQLKP